MATASPGLPTMLGHYRVAEKIGAGGMGEVYRAHDERLDRDVAIKLLPPSEFADDNARKHFRSEALALSKLNHPNIETVHDFDSEQGRDFIVTEYIAGESLDQKLASGSLAEKEILRLGAQLANGLAAAHEQNIIHRDLKPSNLRITRDGRLKILDFGLAKLITPATFDAPTASLMESMRFAGTLPYMAPEQVRGEALDARTDIWAAGVVLYEMATGQRPFCATGLHVAEQILNQAPTAPSALNPRISSALDAIVSKCLDKDPDRRYQSAKELIVDLRRSDEPSANAALPTATHMTRAKVLAFVGFMVAAIAVAATLLLLPGRKPHLATTKQIVSVAVLPLANLSGDPQQDYLADGITESLITDLARLTGLKGVIARGSVMRYKGTKTPLAEIAHDLNVDALITGAVLRSGDRVRVTAQLINPEDGQQLWTESYEQDASDVLRLQNELTKAIAAEIRVKLTADEQARLKLPGLVNPQAYDAYLMGRYHLYKMSPQGFEKALEYFQFALEKDPNYIPALIGSATVWELREQLGYIGAGEGWAKAKPAVMKVLERDPTSADAHQMLAGHLAWAEYKWEAGLREYERALELNPNSADSHFFYSLTLYAMRRPEAIEQIELAIALDPYNAFYHQWLANELTDGRQPGHAFVEFDRAAAIDPTVAGQHIGRMRAYQRNGQFSQAVEELKRSLSVNRPDLVQTLEQAYTTGEYRLAMRSVAKALAAGSPKRLSASGTTRGDTPSMMILAAELYSAAGDDDRALDCLEAAYENRLRPLPYVNARRAFEHMRPNPRFQQLLRRINLLQ